MWRNLCSHQLHLTNLKLFLTTWSSLCSMLMHQCPMTDMGKMLLTDPCSTHSLTYSVAYAEIRSYLCLALLTTFKIITKNEWFPTPRPWLNKLRLCKFCLFSRYWLLYRWHCPCQCHRGPLHKQKTLTDIMCNLQSKLWCSYLYQSCSKL
jgi:hypothetical protein